MRRLRILLLCPKPPFPPVDGGTRAVWELAVGLAEAGHAVHALSVATAAHPDRSPRRDPVAGLTLESVAVDTRLGLAAGLANLASPLPYAVARFVSRTFEDRLKALLAEAWDVVQLEGLPVAPYLPLALQSGARVVFRAHNVEEELWRQRAAGARWPLSAWLQSQAARVGRLEQDCWRRCQAVAAISPAVARACRAVARGPVLELPVGFRVPDAVPPVAEPARLFHLGAMDWGPTADGVAWFLARAWPAVLARHPQAQLHLAGRGVARFAAAHPAPRVVVDGEVEDAGAYVRLGGILVAPVRSGSGLRVKVAEAMVEGRAVVATSLGSEGLGVEDGRELLLADDAGAFAAQVVRCLDEPALVRRLGAAAHAFAAAHFERGRLAARLGGLYDALP